MNAGERLVTVLVTVAVPEAADPEDAAALVADAAVSSALDVVHVIRVRPRERLVTAASPEPRSGTASTPDSMGLHYRGELVDPAVPAAVLVRLVASERSDEVVDVRGQS